MAVPLVETVAQELRFKDSLIRELGEIEALGLSGRELEGALSVRRRALRHPTQDAHPERRAADAVYREVVVARGREPAFWMLLGFTGALLAARGSVVGGTLRYHLEKQMFSSSCTRRAKRIPCTCITSTHGLLLVEWPVSDFSLAGDPPVVVAAAGGLGIGAGLILDEWALIWNLNPDYYQGLSYWAVAYRPRAAACRWSLFRRFWTSWGRRALIARVAS